MANYLTTTEELMPWWQEMARNDLELRNEGKQFSNSLRHRVYSLWLIGREIGTGWCFCHCARRKFWTRSFPLKWLREYGSWNRSWNRDSESWQINCEKFWRTLTRAFFLEIHGQNMLLTRCVRWELGFELFDWEWCLIVPRRKGEPDDFWSDLLEQRSEETMTWGGVLP